MLTPLSIPPCPPPTDLTTDGPANKVEIIDGGWHNGTRTQSTCVLEDQCQYQYRSSHARFLGAAQLFWYCASMGFRLLGTFLNRHRTSEFQVQTSSFALLFKSKSVQNQNDSSDSIRKQNMILQMSDFYFFTFLLYPGTRVPIAILEYLVQYTCVLE